MPSGSCWTLPEDRHGPGSLHLRRTSRQHALSRQPHSQPRGCAWIGSAAPPRSWLATPLLLSRVKQRGGHWHWPGNAEAVEPGPPDDGVAAVLLGQLPRGAQVLGHELRCPGLRAAPRVAHRAQLGVAGGGVVQGVGGVAEGGERLAPQGVVERAFPAGCLSDGHLGVGDGVQVAVGRHDAGAAHPLGALQRVGRGQAEGRRGERPCRRVPRRRVRRVRSAARSRPRRAPGRSRRPGRPRVRRRWSSPRRAPRVRGCGRRCRAAGCGSAARRTRSARRAGCRGRRPRRAPRPGRARPAPPTGPRPSAGRSRARRPDA